MNIYRVSLFGCVASGLFITTSLAQVVTASAQAWTVMRAEAEQSGSSRVVRTIAAGGDLTPGVRLLAQSGNSLAEVDVTLDSGTGGHGPVDYRITERGLGDPPFFRSARGGTGQHETLLSLQATAPVWGKLTVRWVSPQSHIFCRQTCSIDVFHDGTIELSGNAGETHHYEVPLAFGPGTVDVWTSTFGSFDIPSGVRAGYDGELRISFAPDPGCTAQRYGLPCGGLWLRADPTFTRSMELTLGGLSPTSPGLAFFVFGFRPLNQPLPLPPGCTQLTYVFFAEWSPIVARQANYTLNVAPLSGYDFYCQAVVLNGAAGTVTTTDGQHLVCR